MKKPLLRLPNTLTTAIYGPAGSGKTAGFIIPWLLENPFSAGVIDLKGELYKATAKARRRMGHKVVALDPYKLVTDKPDTYNPFDVIPSDSPTLINDCRNFAEALVIRTGKEEDPFWCNGAETVTAAMACFTARHAPPADRSPQTVRELLCNPQHLARAMAALQQSGDFDGLLARMGHQLSHFQDKTAASVLSTALQFSTFLDSPEIVPSMQKSSFDPAELRTGKMTVYLILPAQHFRAQAAVMRLWISSMLRRVVSMGLGEKQQTWWILDEAAALGGNMKCLDDLIERYRGYGCRSIWAFQSRGQLAQSFPAGRHITFEANTTAIYLATRDFDTANYLSNLLGEHTILVDSAGSNQGWSRSASSMRHAPESFSDGTSGGSSVNTTQMARRLKKPDEILTLDPRIAITVSPNLPRPVMTRTVRWYEEKGTFRTSFFGDLFADTRELMKSLLVMILALALAGALTVYAIEQEQAQPPVQQPAYYLR
jgi:type IV secretion system protein VirD4